MKHRLLISFLFLFFVFNAYSGKKKTIQFVVLAGQITNPQSDTIYIKNQTRSVIKKIALNKDNSFIDTLILSEEYYFLSDGNESTSMYLKPGFNLYLTLDTKQFDESIVYTGQGSAENNYLAKSALLEESFGKLTSYSYYAKLNEKEFLHLVDSLYNLNVDLLNNNKTNFNSKLAYWEQLEFAINYKMKLAQYQDMHRFLTGDKDFIVSNTYPDPFIGLDMNRDSLLRFVNYINWIDVYVNKKTKDFLKLNPGNDYYLKNALFINSNIQSKKIKEELACRMVRNHLKYTKQIDSLYKVLSELIETPANKLVLEENYQKIKRISKGQKAPSFTFKDLEGKLVKLEDFKGKLIYIDIWATWCLPCVKDFPNLKALQDTLKGKNIVFVSICRNDNLSRWKEMIKNESLGGVHLFAEIGNDEFFDKFLVSGVPAYLLIDADGNIINASAHRPSSPSLYEEILDNLK